MYSGFPSPNHLHPSSALPSPAFLLPSRRTPSPDPLPIKLYCRPRSPLAASAAIIMELFRENYTVSFDEEDMDLDNPSLYDPSTDSTVSGAEMLTYLMERLDQRRDHSFAQDTEEANQVQRRYRNLCSRIQAGNPLALFMDLYWLLQDREEPVVIGDRATILDIAYFALFFPISMRVWNAGNFGYSAVRRWYNYIASHREVLDGLHAVGWTTASDAFQDLADRHAAEHEEDNA